MVLTRRARDAAITDFPALPPCDDGDRALIVIIGAIVMARIADHATPWLVVGFLALVVLVAVALKKEVT